MRWNNKKIRSVIKKKWKFQIHGLLIAWSLVPCPGIFKRVETKGLWNIGFLGKKTLRNSFLPHLIIYRRIFPIKWNQIPIFNSIAVTEILFEKIGPFTQPPSAWICLWIFLESLDHEMKNYHTPKSNFFHENNSNSRIFGKLANNSVKEKIIIGILAKEFEPP